MSFRVGTAYGSYAMLVPGARMPEHILFFSHFVHNMRSDRLIILVRLTGLFSLGAPSEAHPTGQQFFLYTGSRVNGVFKSNQIGE